MRLFRKNVPLTIEEAQGLGENETFNELIKRLSNHIHIRISWLLKDLGMKEGSDSKILDSIGSFIENEIQGLHYDDAKEMLCYLIKNGRITTHEHNNARLVVIGILQRTLASMNLGNVRYSSINKRRELKTLK